MVLKARTRTLTVREICNESLKLIKENKHLNAFITVCDQDATSQAKRLDQCGNQTKTSGSLFGMPISIKDNFCTRNILTTCASKMLQNFVPPYDATVVRKLAQANTLMMGKTNMDEFAMGSSSTTSSYGPTAFKTGNESSDWLMAGGSSTGSAVSVAIGACFASLGTDTGGSTRQPASFTGTVGFKPTYGLISRFGLIPLVHCLDVVSIIARNVEDVRSVFDVIIGQDENDLTTVDHNRELKSSFNPNTNTINIGVPHNFITASEISSEVSSQFDKIIKNFSIPKFKFVNIDLPTSRLATECYTIISSAEIASNMSCYDGIKFGHSVVQENLTWEKVYLQNRDAGFGAEVKKRILLGNYFLLSGNREKYLVQAYKVRRLINDEFQKAFSENSIDIILMPSTPTTSVTHAMWLLKQDSNKLFREDYFLIPANLANLPSISLPAGLTSNKLPIGLQLVANKFHDLDLLNISKLFEAALKDL